MKRSSGSLRRSLTTAGSCMLSSRTSKLQKKLSINTRGLSVSYDIIHVGELGERVIGSVTDDFVEDIDAIISPHGSPWPKSITDLYVSGVRSYISNDYKSVWCWVDFCGLGNSHTDVY